MLSERDHWLSITDDPQWRRNHIADPNISLNETLAAITKPFPQSPKRILEIGCGYGRLTREIGRRYIEAEVFGQDISPLVLRAACDYDPGTTFCDGPLIALPPMDAVYSVAVFQHLPDLDKRRYIVEAAGVMNLGGALRIQFIEGDRNNFNDHWVDAEQMVSWCDEAGFTNIELDRGLAHRQWTWITAVK
ncbi:hypothetical protein BKG82_23100 [Mycobacteroides chelonae]|uniref:Methyltransferase domain-containing protein n=1 Tax=Mycobacteroides chelonae TaxID=1774 RepID=A0A1S1LPB2_MYCCH|nr:hypothetical protein BKG82_23100 [Mycobacteroides chelonae]